MVHVNFGDIGHSSFTKHHNYLYQPGLTNIKRVAERISRKNTEIGRDTRPTGHMRGDAEFTLEGFSACLNCWSCVIKQISKKYLNKLLRAKKYSCENTVERRRSCCPVQYEVHAYLSGTRTGSTFRICSLLFNEI